MAKAKLKEPQKASGPVTDLDAILESPGSVVLHGKTHTIKPVLVGEFFAFANAMASVEQLRLQEKVGLKDLIDAYYGIISPIVPTITKDDLRECTQAQISGLLSLVNLHVTGNLTDEKKKSLKTNPAQLLNP